MLTSPEKRAEFIAGLREIADYLDAHPGVPVPDYPDIVVHANDGDDEEKRRAVDQAAAELDAEARDPLGSGHYKAVRRFGPIEYAVLAISKAHMALFEARHSYADNITATA